MKMFNISTDELLVSIVQKHPEIYDKQNYYYKNDEHKQKSWTFIAKSLDRDAETVKRRWDNLRDRFVRAYREWCDSPLAGTDQYPSKFRLFEHMLWLTPYIRKRRITSLAAAAQRKSVVGALLNPLNPSIEDIINESQNNETQDSLNLKTEIQSVASDAGINESYEIDEDGIMSSTSSDFKKQATVDSFVQNENKSDHYFMMSIVQDCQNLPPRKKFKFKRDVLQLLEKYMYEDDSQN